MRYNLFHISKDPNLNHLTPKIPEQAEIGFEDTTIPRVCCCSSIDKCLIAMCGVCNNEKLYVYKLNITDDKIVYTPRKVKKYVTDASFTKEHWILDQVDVQKLGTIEIDYSGDDYYNDVFAGWINIKWHWINVCTF